MTDNYIILGCQGDGFYDVAYSDLKHLEGVYYYNHPLYSLPTPLLRVLGRIVFKPSLNHFFPCFVERLIYRQILADKLDKDGQYCFLIFYPTFVYLKKGLVLSLKKSYPHSKFVLYFQDIIASYPDIDNDLPFIKDTFDAILTYDKGDSIKYDFIYYPTPYSRIRVPVSDDIPESDVYFCGKAKNRFQTIYKAYCDCRESGLKCDFYIMGLKMSSQIEAPGLHYDTPLSYMDNLQHIRRTKCILEIMQDGAVGYTPRLWESIVFDKHLLSNNISLLNTDYNNHKYVHLFDRDIKMPQQWIDVPVEYEQCIKEQLSPKYLLSFLERILANNEPK